MDKRIKELLDQCTDPELTKPWPLIDAGKFAELVIRECRMLAVGNANWLPKDVSPATGMDDVFKRYFNIPE